MKRPDDNCAVISVHSPVKKRSMPKHGGDGCCTWTHNVSVDFVEGVRFGVTQRDGADVANAKRV